jgi:uncharacterized protein (DUF2236 family)
MDGIFPLDSAIRRVNAHPVVMLGGGRALLMQLAHPLIARGVAEHSTFHQDQMGRLARTIKALNTIVYGSEREARRTSEGLAAVHRHITGEGYSANDPDLLLWVHATLVDTAIRMHARFLRPLPDEVAAAYYADSMVLGELFGIPRASQPPTLTAFRAYVRDMVGTLAVSDEGRELARIALHPPLPLVTDPLLVLGRQLTTGLLPEPLRRQFGLPWDRPRAAALQVAGVSSRLVTPGLFGILHRLPLPPGVRSPSISWSVTGDTGG